MIQGFENRLSVQYIWHWALRLTFFYFAGSKSLHNLENLSIFLPFFFPVGTERVNLFFYFTHWKYYCQNLESSLTSHIPGKKQFQEVSFLPLERARNLKKGTTSPLIKKDANTIWNNKCKFCLVLKILMISVFFAFYFLNVVYLFHNTYAHLCSYFLVALDFVHSLFVSK